MTFIALFDILGFRGHLRHERLEAVVERMRSLDEIVTHSSRLPVARGQEQIEGAFYAEINREETCRWIRFSDTILLYAEETEQALPHLILNSLQLLGWSFRFGIPMRGAVTRGELYVSEDRSIFVGEGLIRAHDLQQSQDWAGAILDPEKQRIGEEQIPPRLRKILLDEGALFEYPAPMKQGLVVPYFCLGWPAVAGVTSATLRRSFSKFGGPLESGARAKIDNTVRFMSAYRRAMVARRRRRMAPKPDDANR